MPTLSHSFAHEKLCVDFTALGRASPKGVYVAPVPDYPLRWSGVLFVRRGPYASAILRFQIDFPDDHRRQSLVIVFLSDVFHPLVSPLTTYTYSTREAGVTTVSATDKQRLPPGGISLRHGFPEWFGGGVAVVSPEDDPPEKLAPLPHIVEVLHYLRVVFDTEAVLDSIPLEAAANSGAWHAWRSHRSKLSLGRAATSARREADFSDTSSTRSTSPRQQPGGARRPAEWNWQGVWEDRVRKCIAASASEQTLYGGDRDDIIAFAKMEEEL